MNIGSLLPRQMLARGSPSSPPAPPSSCPVSTSVTESVEAEGAVTLVPGEVEELKVAVGLCGEGQVEFDVAILIHLGPWALVLPVHPEPAGRTPQLEAQPLLRRGCRGRVRHMPSCHPLPSGFQKGEACQLPGCPGRRCSLRGPPGSRRGRQGHAQWFLGLARPPHLRLLDSESRRPQ